MRFVLLSLAAWSALATAADGPSFDCAKAATWVELRICDSADLSSLDRKMAKSYRSALRFATEAEARKIKRDGVAWRTQVRDKCLTTTCLLDAYEIRLAEFSQTRQAPSDSLNKAFVLCLQGAMEKSPVYTWRDGGRSAVAMLGMCAPESEAWIGSCIQESGDSRPDCSLKAGVMAQAMLKIARP